MADPRVDTNGVIAGLLRDLAAIQSAEQSRWGYRRAAETVFYLDEPIESLLLPSGGLAKIPSVGPKSERVVLEVLAQGASPTVERLVQESGKAAQVQRARELRDRFLSRAQVVATLRDATLTGPRLDGFVGDFQTHSTWSDGSQTLDDLIVACLARGYHTSAITDHSHGLRVAGGMSMEDVARQHREIDELNATYSGRFRLLKGVEANILADGTLDLSPNELATFEVVVAAPHAALRSQDDQTARMRAAVRTRGVHLLGHPRGRKYGERAGIVADWEAVFADAAAANVAVEIDGDPSRQDIDFDLARRAVDAGCLFALDSDAHATSQLSYAETAIAHARLAGVPADRVINYWPLERLLSWLADRPRER